MTFLRTLLATLLTVLWAACAAAQSGGIVELPAALQTLEISAKGTSVAAQRRNVVLEVPGDKEGERAVLELRGTGAGPEFFWTLFTLKNTGPEEREFVISVARQRLSASGFLRLQPFGTRLQSVSWNGSEDRIRPSQQLLSDAYEFKLGAGENITIAFEGPPELSGVRVYDPRAFATQGTSFSFLAGAMLATTALMSLAILMLYALRGHLIYLAGTLLSLAALVFLALEAGYLDGLRPLLADRGRAMDHVRAVSEVTFALTLAILLLATLFRARSLTWLAIVAGLAAAAIAIGWAILDPSNATRAARVAVVLFAIVGLGTSALRKADEEIGERHALAWAAVAAFALLATMATMAGTHSNIWHALLMAGTATMISVLTFALMRQAFADPAATNPLLSDAGRRSLALAGAQHYLWDWQPRDNKLNLDTALAIGLGFPTEHFSHANAAGTFASLLHPADVAGYQAALDLRGLKTDQILEHDFRLKNVDGEYRWFELRARLLPQKPGLPARAIGTLTDITRHRLAQESLIQEPARDPVTGLPSRVLFRDRLEREVEKPLGLPVRVMLVGLERFKQLNDGLGHDLGDQLLLVAGQRISDCLTADETLTRLTGSQFAVMYVEAIDSRPPLALAEELIAKLGAPIPLAAQTVHLSVCIGISQLSSSGFGAEALQSQAAAALFEAQQQGPGTALIHKASMVDERADKLALEADLRRAINRHEIELHYQPIVNLRDRTIAGVEALARWNHPERGPLPPSEFIEMAEQAGLIGEVGDMVLAEATRQLGIWQRTLTRGSSFFVSVNASAGQLSDPDYVDKVSAALRREDIPAQSLKIELTESVVMRFPERALQLITRLNDMGVGVACDDFGTGFSNLASLRDLHFNTLKMDRSFIATDSDNRRGDAIMGAVIALAHELGMRVVAEGVETEEQVELLMALGCEWGQGYLLGEPIPARELQSALAVLPQVEASPELKAIVPEPGAAPMAPRQMPATDEEVDEVENDALFEAPQVLPSIFSVATKPVAPKRSSKAKRKSRSRIRKKPKYRKK